MSQIAKIKYQAIPLPSDVLAEKMAGNFDQVRKLIAKRLTDEYTPECIKERLRLEEKMLFHLEDEYCYTVDEALALMQEKIPDFTMEELEDLMLRGRIDFAYINGEKKIIDSFRGALIYVYPEIWNRTAEGDDRDYAEEDSVIKGLKDGDKFGAHIHMHSTVTLHPQDDVKGQVARVHLPITWEGNSRISNLKLTTEPAYTALSADEAGCHTVYFEGEAKDGESFMADYEYDYIDVFRDMYNMDPALCTKTPSKEIMDEFTKEVWPHIVFTPFIKTLTQEIIGDETNPLLKARAIYNFITTRCKYRFTRNYSCIENVSEWFLINQQGDCGTQALAFITLCRCAGVPARWESGRTAGPNGSGMHDWAMFYIEGFGWRHADCSFGGGSNTRGDEWRRQFYFGNIDPWRVPCNQEQTAEFDPPKKFQRMDDSDNQTGEIEFETRGAKYGEYDRSNRCTEAFKL
ncbi:MAG: transglutaminase domain-containing protein [Clostridia bacterium]|nr:transglutaminase domain-containing protein [Clostridia bacterium]